MTNANALLGGILTADSQPDDLSDLCKLITDIGQKSSGARAGRGTMPETLDRQLWTDLCDTGLARLTSTPSLDAGPAELALVLYTLARHAAAAPIAQTDLLAAWLISLIDHEQPQDAVLTVACADSQLSNGWLRGVATDVPWASAADAIVIAARTADGLRIAVATHRELSIQYRHNLAGEPRDTVLFELPHELFSDPLPGAERELIRRGAWARCVQAVGALDAVAELTLQHTREREQFGKSLSQFQAVQQSLAAMAGLVEEARATVNLAVSTTVEYGFDSPATEFAVNCAKVTCARVVSPANTVAHQLHGAIGTTLEHQLWRVTSRARSWTEEFGRPTASAVALGAYALAAPDPWDICIGLAPDPQHHNGKGAL
ncbi:acyl-CoA dehydrogenase family protein [Mycobacterium genavense]|uniref:acyl-CoA dehydrogenase family protein n=1 Tax=Mycobacterium genavense TaxID=36812 RepID=UPI0004ACC7E1|nr:acyl-CoA dehydrogenase family protein [Mycobacterium genavense]